MSTNLGGQMNTYVSICCLSLLIQCRDNNGDGGSSCFDIGYLDHRCQTAIELIDQLQHVCFELDNVLRI